MKYVVNFAQMEYLLQYPFLELVEKYKKKKITTRERKN